MQGKCINCGSTGYVERHHVFFGSKRKKCDRFPLLIFSLCPTCHRAEKGVHGRDGHTLNMKLKKEAQQIFEKEYGSRKQFISTFGRSYL